MQGTPKKGRRFGGSASHQRLLMANLVSSLIAAEAIVTTEAKAKALRPIAEKVITKARKGGLHNHRQILAYLGDQEIAAIDEGALAEVHRLDGAGDAGADFDPLDGLKPAGKLVPGHGLPGRDDGDRNRQGRGRGCGRLGLCAAASTAQESTARSDG